jgi:Ca2+-binding RTX toxin-like protein
MLKSLVALSVSAALLAAPAAVAAGDITGTDARDRITGTPGDDVIRALAGDDLVRSRGGDDRVVGGAGDDRRLGRRWGDLVSPGAGADVVRTHRGPDQVGMWNDGRPDVVDCGGGSRDWVGYHDSIDPHDRFHGCEKVVVATFG